MRTNLVSAILFLAATLSSGQATNPQNTFANAVSSNSPSLWLNFNDSTSAFQDSVSGIAFGPGSPTPSGQGTVGFFNGTDDYVHATTSALTSNSVFSYVGWVYLSSASMSGIIFSDASNNNVGSPGSGVAVAVGSVSGTPGNGNYLNVLIGAVAWQQTGSTIGTGWHFIAVTRDGTTMRAYIDGVQTGTLTNSTAVPLTPTGGVWMGQSSTGSNLFSYFGGRLSQWAMYNTALTGAQITTLYGGGSYVTGLVATWAINEGSGSTVGDSVSGDNGTWGGTAAGNAGYYLRTVSPTPTVRQPGFDATNNANYSASFAYNEWSAAPNLTLGSGMEWNTPWTLIAHIDKLNWDHSGVLTLASRGDFYNSAIHNINWRLYIQQNTNNATIGQLCFSRQSPAPYTNLLSPAFTSTQFWCSPGNIDVMPNGFNYDIVIEDNGAGGGGNVTMSINGVVESSLINTGSTPNGFGGITAVVTTGGTGYPTSGITIAASGGGTYCTVTGTASAPSGGITSVTVVGSHGCTSAPTIVLSSSSGSGAVITATAYPMTMSSPLQPLLVPGYVNNAVYYGPGGSDSAMPALNVDEFAVLPGNLSFSQITNIFYTTKFYQGLLFPGLLNNPNPPLVVFGNSGCGPDVSGNQTTAMLIGAHQAGLIRLIGVTDDDGNANGSNSAGWFRQILDQAGLADVPVSIGASSRPPNLGGCPASLITAYNANTPQTPAMYETAATMYRTLFAQYPATPIYVMMTQTANGYNNFQLSAADSISPLTGMQLQAQNYANGGWVNGFEGNLATTPSSYTSLFNNMGASNNLPIFFEGGSPIEAGPGILAGRLVTDPMRASSVAQGSDQSQGWTNQNVAQLLSPYFQGGVQIAYSGGTGYASNTPFTSVGGGQFCNVTGYMISSGGVPSSTYSYLYSSISSTYNGAGYGCSPAVFTATGSGTNLTVSAITCCNLSTIGADPPILSIGDTISGTGIPAGTTIVSQTSGPTGGPGVYVSSVATTASASTVTREPTILLTSPTGTGVTMTVVMGTHIVSYAGSSTATYIVWPNVGSFQPLFQYFQNSLMDPVTTGATRSH
jgi:Concanavalin A-like lectin/glucanases superfamily